MLEFQPKERLWKHIMKFCPGVRFLRAFPGRKCPEILGCLDKRVVEIPKGDPVFLEGEPARFVGVVLSGGVQIVRDDYYGRRSVLTVVSPGELFAEAFVCAGVDALPVSAFALAEQHRAASGLPAGDDRAAATTACSTAGWYLIFCRELPGKIWR